MIYEEKIQEEIDYAIEKAKAATKEASLDSDEAWYYLTATRGRAKEMREACKEAEAKWKAAKIAWKGVRAWEEYLKKVESL